jgi:hypothetical protein
MTTTAEVQARHDAYEEVIDNYNAIPCALKIAPIEHTDRGYLLEQLEQTQKAQLETLRMVGLKLDVLKSYTAHRFSCDKCTQGMEYKCSCGLQQLLEVKS